MTRVTILYPKSSESRFDLDYYLNTHIPMSEKAFGHSLLNMSVEVGVAGGAVDAPAPYAVVCNFTFESLDAFLSVFLPNAEMLQGDIQKFTNVVPVIQISEVIVACWGAHSSKHHPDRLSTHRLPNEDV
jgi:uncharacterized protein (TIGR02118 family)